jgi:hypothetical protein
MRFGPAPDFVDQVHRSLAVEWLGVEEGLIPERG